jgi:hypothetical protein
MEVSEQLIEFALLATAIGVMAAGAVLSRANIPFKVWHGVLGWLVSLGLLIGVGVRGGAMPEGVVLTLSVFAVLLGLASAAVFYTARRRRLGEAPAERFAPVMRDRSSEPILGWFEARKTSVWKPDIEYALLVANHRLVAVRIGGQFSGEPLNDHDVGAFSFFLQREAEAFRDRRRAALQRVFASADIDALLWHHRANFQFQLEELKGARLESRPWYAQLAWQGIATLVLEPRSGPPLPFLLQRQVQVELCVGLLHHRGVPLQVAPELLGPRAGLPR